MKFSFKLFSMLTWVVQFGFSALFPVCFFLVLASWMQNRLGFGAWIVIVMGCLGLLTSISTARSCIRSMKKEADAVGRDEKPPVAFNDHK